MQGMLLAGSYSKCKRRYHLSHNFQAYCTCMDNQIRWQLGLGREQITYMENVIIYKGCENVRLTKKIDLY